jgi:hypothetical protein
MAKAFTCDMSTSRINATIAALQQITGGDFRDITRAEFQNVLEKVVSNTPVASVALINETKNPRLRAQVGRQRAFKERLGNR